MDGNLAMANHIVNETEEANNFWAEVNYLMENKGLSKDEATAKVQKEWFETEHSPNNTDFL